MTVATTYSRAEIGIEAPPVTVEADVLGGLPQIQIVGLPEPEVKESKDRVKSAIKNANYDIPDRRLTINLAPADLPKTGGRYDLAIALAILGASNQIPPEALSKMEFLGELALDGKIRSISGVLPSAIQASRTDRRGGYGRRLCGRADRTGPPQGGTEDHQAGYGYPAGHCPV